MKTSSKKFFLSFPFFICCSVSIFSQGTWTQKADFGGTARISAVGFSIGTKGYICTGIDTITFHKQDLWEWDQMTNIWTQRASIPSGSLGGRREAIAFSIGSKGYVGTGIENQSYLQDFWEWDQATNIWANKAQYGGGFVFEAVAFSIGNKGYVGTGIGKVPGTTCGSWDFWEFNATANSWTQKANLAGARRYGAIGFSIGNKGYIGGGRDGYTSTNLSDFWEWDQSTNTWNQKANIPGVSYCNDEIGFSIATKGYASKHPAGFWCWDQATNVWTKKADFADGMRHAAVGFSIGNSGYIGTGYNAGNIHQKDFWEYCDTCNTTSVYENNPMEVTINPNPTSGIISIKSNVSDGKIEIYDLRGQSVFSGNIHHVGKAINISHFSNGVYLFSIKTSDGLFVRKIIKE